MAARTATTIARIECFEVHDETGFSCSKREGHKGRHVAYMNGWNGRQYITSWKR